MSVQTVCDQCKVAKRTPIHVNYLKNGKPVKGDPGYDFCSAECMVAHDKARA